jgi:hypothetical protein
MNSSMLVLHVVSVWHVVSQAAARAQKASVTAAEVQRYLEYDARHGAKYVDYDAPPGGMDQDEEEW